MTAPKAARKDSYGTRFYPIPDAEGNNADLMSVTAIQKILAAPALVTWKLKTVATWMSRRPDLVALAGIDAWKAVTQALDAESAAANTGTAVHGYTEPADDGTLDLAIVPDGARHHIERYLEAKAVHKWTVVEAEVTVFNHTHGYAGTLDRILDIPGIGRVVCDIKTGKGVYPDTALQLAFYANAEGIWAPSNDVEVAGQRRAMPEELRKDLGYVIHLHEDFCKLVPIDLTGAWEACCAISTIGTWQKRKGIVGKALTAPAPTKRERIVNELRQLPADAMAQVAAHWPDGVPGFKGGHEHTNDELEAIEQVVHAITSLNDVAFVATIEEQAPAVVIPIDRGKPETPEHFMDTAASKQARDHIIKRLKSLDADLLAEVQDKAREVQIPNLKTTAVLNVHIDYLTIYLEAAEAKQMQRRQADVFVQ